MSYNKSDNSSNYNKEERGGWYCTNPKKHDEQEMHHGADEPHTHRAERNDAETVRQPESRARRSEADNAAGRQQHRNPFEIPNPSNTEEPKPANKTKKTCLGCIVLILLGPFLMAIIAALIETIAGDQSSDEEYYEEYIDSVNSDEIEVNEEFDL